MAVIGDILIEPEVGWRRYDDTHAFIKYKGNWQTYLNSSYYGGSHRYTTSTDSPVIIRFLGKKFRLIGQTSPDHRSESVTVLADGVAEEFNQKAVRNDVAYKVLMYEKEFSVFGEHTVIITNNMSGSNQQLAIDAIDIDEEGEILPPPRDLGEQLPIPDPGWKRYDSSYSSIKYKPFSAWTHTTGSQYYSRTLTYTRDYANTEINFYFKGTKIRIIAGVYTDHSQSIGVTIDGVTETYSAYRSGLSQTLGQILVYEKEGLPNTVHEVTIKAIAAGNYSLDAVDIDEDGELIPPPREIGEQLTQPDVGWKRYDNTHPAFAITGATQTNQSAAYNGNYHYTNNSTADTKVRFDFVGTKLRVVTSVSPNYSDSVEINVDGVTYTYDETILSNYHQILVFELTGLPQKRHTVIVDPPEGKYFAWDALDIDADGRLLHPDEVLYFDELDIGKRIRVHYTSKMNNVVGTFSRVFEETYVNGTANDFIPTNSTSTPDGDFYFIVVDDRNGKKILVADRNIQHTISWDTLNKHGLVFGDKLYLAATPHNMTSESNDIGTASASSVYNDSTYQAWRAFDGIVANGTNNAWVTQNGETTGWLQFEFKSPKRINGYEIRNRNYTTNNASVLEAPRDWTFEAWDGEKWVILDARTNVTDWVNNTYKKFFINNDREYTTYRINITANNGHASWVGIAELIMYEPAFSEEVKLRLMTGGVTSTDKDSEWDNYIVYSSLGGKITPGDDAVWNWNGRASWTSSTPTNNAANRTRRGYTAVGNFYNDRASSQTDNLNAYRPVLEIETSVPMFVGSLDKNEVHGEPVVLTGLLRNTGKQVARYRITVNGIQVYPTNGYTQLVPTPHSVNYVINNNALNIGPNRITIWVNDGERTTFRHFTVYKTSVAPEIVATMEKSRLDFTITDVEGDKVQFKIILNGVQVYPLSGDFTELENQPVSFSRAFNSREAPPGVLNTVLIVAKDQFGAESTKTLIFEGTYSGLMFADLHGNYYSTDVGEVLQYLDFGVLVAGQISEAHPVRLINMTGYDVKNIIISRNRKTLPNGTYVEISKTEAPFIAEPELVYNELKEDDELTFYIRIVTMLSGEPGEGDFEVLVVGDPS